MLAARPKTLTAALIPIIVATPIAAASKLCEWRAIIICALFAALMQIAANLINDLIDFRKGTDREDRLGPERACAQGWITPRAMRIGIAVTLVTALAIGSLILIYGQWSTVNGQWSMANGQWSIVNGQWSMIILGGLCVLFAFLYTTILSYAGMGDLLVLMFFGLVPCCGTCFAATGEISTESVIAGLICGILIDTLLIINNYRDRDTDRLNGKRTLIARLGERFGRYFYLGCGLTAWLLTLAFLPWHGLWPSIITLPYLLLHLITWHRMVSLRQGRALNGVLGLTSRNMFLFGLLLAASLCIQN